MEKIIKENNETKYYINNDLLLTITELEDNCFITENSEYKIKGNINIVDDFKTEIKITEHKKKDKRGHWRNSKKLLSHNMNWFSYILQEKGFVRKAKAI